MDESSESDYQDASVKTQPCAGNERNTKLHANRKYFGCQLNDKGNPYSKDQLKCS